MTNLTYAKSILGFSTRLTQGIANGLADGKYDVADAITMLPSLAELPGAIQAAQSLQAGTLTESEIAELLVYAKTELALPQANVEKRIEDALALAAAIAVYVKTWTDGTA